PEAQREDARAALRAENCLAQRLETVSIKALLDSRKLVEVARVAVETQPAPEPLTRLDPPVGAHDDGQIGRGFDEARQSLGLRGDEGRAPLHRNPASDGPQPREQPQRRKQAQREEKDWRSHRDNPITSSDRTLD